MTGIPVALTIIAVAVIVFWPLVEAVITGMHNEACREHREQWERTTSRQAQ